MGNYTKQYPPLPNWHCEILAVVTKQGGGCIAAHTENLKAIRVNKASFKNTHTK